MAPDALIPTNPRVLLHVPAEDPALGPGRHGWLSFQAPHDVLVARSVGDVPAVLERLRAAVAAGRWAAGFLSYEATPAFDPAFAAHEPLAGVPLAWWGLFDAPQRLTQLPAAPEHATAGRPPPELEWTAQVSRDEHAAAVSEVRRLIEEGETYQVNLTFPLVAEFGDDFEFQGDAYRLFTRWLQPPPSVPAPPPPYAAWIDTGELAVASASPELFFRLDGSRLRARPMKGTAPRGRWLEEDEERLRQLASEKNRAENLMIADMTRNDLGRVAVPGSVRVTNLFGVESYATVHQLTTEVTAELEPGLDAVDVLAALFPSASITGAPKARTSHVIRHLERHPRGVYTGSAGFLAPDGSALLNVLIRTALFDRPRRSARFGTGGGVVWDSRAESEYDEARTKASVLRTKNSVLRTRAPRASDDPDDPKRGDDFRLLETLLWRPKSGFFLLRRHLERLAASGRFFAFSVPLEEIESELRRRAATWTERMRVRLLVDRAGDVEIECAAEPCPGRRTLRLVLDDRPVDETDVFLCHKTTRRGVYEEAAARHPSYDDVLLWNCRGELTESTRANLVLEIEGRRLTPPRNCGLLAGTYRDQLLAEGRLEVRELSRLDLEAADRIFLLNSVRGWMPAEVEGSEPTVR